MAVIWVDKIGDRTFVTSSGEQPTSIEVKDAREYDLALRNKFSEIRLSLKKKGFFEEKDKLKKWRMLGIELQFLDNFSLRKKCDPNFDLTWRALYDIASDLAPEKEIPSDKSRANGPRNHFYISYLLGQLSDEQVNSLSWSSWNDIHMSFSSEMWKDNNRLIKWIFKIVLDKNSLPREKLRLALKALRRAVGENAKLSTMVLSDEELYNLLDKNFESVNNSTEN